MLRQGPPADAELTRESLFLLPATSAAAEIYDLVVRQRFLATSVDPALLGQCDIFAPPLESPALLVRHRENQDGLSANPEALAKLRAALDKLASPARN